MKNVSVIAVAALLSVACGHDAALPGVPAFQQATQSAAETLDQYCSTPMDAGDCPSAEGQYEREMEPLVERIHALSPNMDACMGAMGHAGSGDMMATSESMMDELHLHAQDACGPSTTESSDTERRRHCRVMGELVDHQMTRADSMQTMMDHGGMMSGSECNN